MDINKNMVEILVWGNGSWVWLMDKDGEDVTVRKSSTNSYRVMLVPSDWSSEKITKSIINYLYKGDLPDITTDAEEVLKEDDKPTETLSFLADDDGIKVVIKPSNKLACEVYATKGSLYGVHNIDNSLCPSHYKEIREYVQGMNTQVQQIHKTAIMPTT